MTRRACLFLGTVALALVACGVSVLGTAPPPDPDPADGSTIEASLPPDPGDGAVVGDGLVGESDASADAPCLADVAADPTNCGVCGHDCLGGACADAACQPIVLLSGLSAPFGLAVDGQRIYWSSPSAGTITAALLDGGSPAVIVGDAAAASPAYIAVEGDTLYWANRLDNPAGSVAARPLDGGVVRSVSKDQEYPTGIAVIGTTVYWTIQQQDGLERGLPDGGAVSVTGSLNYPEDIVSDGTNMFVASPGNGIMRVDLPGGARTTLSPFTAAEWAAGITLDGDTLYFTFEKTGTVARMPKAGGAVQTIASGQDDPHGVAVDARAIYWANRGAKTIMRLAK